MSESIIVEQGLPKKRYKMQTKVLMRRERIKKIVMRGYHTAREIKDALLSVEKINVSLKTIDRDIAEIFQELRKEVGTEKVDQMLINFQIQNRGLEEEAWKTYSKAGNENARVGALRLIHDIQHDKIKILQSMGIIREIAPLQSEPIRIEFVEPVWAKKEDKDANKPDVQAVAKAGAVPPEPSQV